MGCGGGEVLGSWWAQRQAWAAGWAPLLLPRWSTVMVRGDDDGWARWWQRWLVMGGGDRQRLTVELKAAVMGDNDKSSYDGRGWKLEIHILKLRISIVDKTAVEQKFLLSLCI
ncbi:hypothetical protein Dimus_027546 [Dionaea muscipula]